MPVSSFSGPLAREPIPLDVKNGVRTSCAQSPGVTALTRPKLKNGSLAGAFRYLIRHQIVPPSASPANFSDAEAECEVRIPAHAFDYLGIPETTIEAKDLLSDDKPMAMELKADCCVKIVVKGYSCRAYKFIV